jgi:hypothetical protein
MTVASAARTSASRAPAKVSTSFETSSTTPSVSAGVVPTAPSPTGPPGVVPVPFTFFNLSEIFCRLTPPSDASLSGEADVPAEALAREEAEGRTTLRLGAVGGVEERVGSGEGEPRLLRLIGVALDAGSTLAVGAGGKWVGQADETKRQRRERKGLRNA